METTCFWISVRVNGTTVTVAAERLDAAHNKSNFAEKLIFKVFKNNEMKFVRTLT